MKAEVDYRGKIHVEGTINFATEVILTPNDIYNWVLSHDTPEDVEMLKTLSKQIHRHIDAIEHPDDDDFRSRA